jgi:hypothetical protein
METDYCCFTTLPPEAVYSPRLLNSRDTKHSEVALYLRNYMQLERGRLLRKTIPFSSVGNTNVIDEQSREVGRQVGAQNDVKMKYTCTSKRTPLQSSYPLHAVLFGGKLVTRQYEHRSL